MANGKTLCIATGIYPPDTGGPAKFAETFLSWCKESNIYAECVSLTDATTHSDNLSSSNVYLISRNQPLVFRYWNTVKVLVTKMKSGRIVLANGLFLETYIASILSRKEYFCKVPGDIVWERARNRNLTNKSIDDFQDSKLSFKYRIFRTLFSKSLKRAKGVIVPSQHLFNLCILWGVKESNLHLIYNSVDTERFQPQKETEVLFDVLVVNRLVPWKHVDEVIIACAQLNLHLAIVGDGPERNSLEMLARTKGGKVTFFGEVNQANLPKLFQSASCYVLNSSFEATSYSLLEARSSGLFCIANGSTGSDEIIHHGIDGLLCNKSDFKLFNALKQFTIDHEFVESARNLAMIDTRSRFDLQINFRLIKELVLTT